jgi:hypothetical protein
LSRVITANSIIQANPQQVTGNLPDGDVVVLSLKNGVYFGLNSVGGFIWTSLQKPITVQEIYQLLLDEFDVDAQQCYTELIKLLEDLSKNGLIQYQEMVETVAEL